ncbi:MAG: hypothetical protein ACPGWR_30985 [Ardenticatenaceae bacterium]
MRVLPSHEEILRGAAEGCVFYLPNEQAGGEGELWVNLMIEGCVLG